MFNINMKIIKTLLTKDGEILTVWTDLINNIGFNFKANSIIDSDDLLIKLKERINKYVDDLKKRQNYKNKEGSFKGLEGFEF